MKRAFLRANGSSTRKKNTRCSPAAMGVHSPGANPTTDIGLGRFPDALAEPMTRPLSRMRLSRLPARKRCRWFGRTRLSFAAIETGSRWPEFLRSGWFDVRNNYKMHVEYVGDEQVGGLHCHKLKCQLDAPWKNPEGRIVPSNYFFVWLARDRNLIAVRHEWREPGWCEKLPTGINFVDDLKEIRPGIWFPYHTVQLVFQKFGREGLCENRPLLQWRRDIRVQSLTPDPTVDGKLFAENEVPAGTVVSVEDEQGDSIGQFKQLKTGNIDVSPEQLLAMRKKAKVDKDAADRRQKRRTR